MDKIIVSEYKVDTAQGNIFIKIDSQDTGLLRVNKNGLQIKSYTNVNAIKSLNWIGFYASVMIFEFDKCEVIKALGNGRHSIKVGLTTYEISFFNQDNYKTLSDGYHSIENIESAANTINSFASHFKRCISKLIESEV